MHNIVVFLFHKTILGVEKRQLLIKRTFSKNTGQTVDSERESAQKELVDNGLSIAVSIQKCINVNENTDNIEKLPDLFCNIEHNVSRRISDKLLYERKSKSAVFEKFLLRFRELRDLEDYGEIRNLKSVAESGLKNIDLQY